MKIPKILFALCLLVTLFAVQARASGILLVATDEEDFDNVSPDRIARIVTNGATVVSQTNWLYDTFHVNGMADAGAYLLAGAATGSSDIHRIDWNTGADLGSFTGA